MPLRPAVFLDRDGVLNARRVGLVRRPGQLELLPGVGAALARLAATDRAIVVVTNQGAAGIGWIPDLDAVHRRLATLVQDAGGRLDAIEACTHPRWRGCACRKPRPGLLRNAAERLGLDPARSWMVGDKPSDIEAGRRFGARTVWVRGGRKYPWERRWDPPADVVADDLPGAVEAILAADAGAPSAPALRRRVRRS